MTRAITLPEDHSWIAIAARQAADNMHRHHGCAQSILAAFMAAFHMDAPAVMRSAAGMMGGLMVSETCGIHTAGMMILGMLMGREDIGQGLDGLWPIVVPGQELMARLTQKLGAASCRELTGVDFTDLPQAAAYMAGDGHARCVARVQEGAMTIADHLMRLQRAGALFTPEIIPARTNAH